MKKYHLFHFFFLLIGFNLNAQCWKTINTISTKPGATGSINTFDWTQETVPMYLALNWNTTTLTCPAMNITLPMYSQSASTFQNLNCLQYQSMLPTEKDHQFEDGWELLIKDFGAPTPQDKNVENPMYALYNRYTSKVRVFIMLTTKASSLSLTGAYIEMSFVKDTRKTALFQHANPIGFPIQVFETQNPMRIPNYLENKNFYWFTAEFPVAYDPCTCVLNHLKKSKIAFRLLANEDAFIEAKINGTFYQNVVAGTQPGATDKSLGINLLGADLNDVSITAKKGFEGYKTYEAYRQSFNKGLDQVDAYYKQIINQKLANAYPTGITIGSSTFAPTIDALKGTDEGIKILSGSNYDANAVKNLKGVASAIPYVGMFLGVVDYLSTMDKQKAAATPAKPTPINYSVDLSFNGSIKKENPINSYTLNTPGTQPNNAPLGAPNYNNILGTINILSIPQLEYVEYNPISPPGSQYPKENIYPTFVPFIPNIRQYRLTNELKYVLNPASNLKVLSAEATYVLEFSHGDGNVIFGTNPINSVLWHDIDQMPVEFVSSAAEIVNLSIPERMEKQGWELDYLSKDYFSYVSGGVGPNAGAYRIRTPYSPLQCFKNVAFNLYHHTSTTPNSTADDACCRNKTPKLILKIIFKLGKVNSTATQNKEVVTSLMTFDMTDAVTKATKATIQTGNLNYYFDGELASGAPSMVYHARRFENFPIFPTAINAPKVITLENTALSYDIYAQDEIIIKDQVVINAGVNLYAGRKITSDATLHSPNYGNVSFNIGKTSVCNKEIETVHESDAEIISRCNSTSYINKAENNKTLAIYDTTNEQKEMDFNIDISPNPNNGSFTVISTINGEHDVVISDLTGKIVLKDKFISKEEFLFNIMETRHLFKVECGICLQSGIYFIKARVNGMYAVKKILITR